MEKVLVYYSEGTFEEKEIQENPKLRNFMDIIEHINENEKYDKKKGKIKAYFIDKIIFEKKIKKNPFGKGKMVMIGRIQPEKMDFYLECFRRIESSRTENLTKEQ